ncbi:DUF427 domain-containing protein [Chthonobacter albigriseus]|uniref:DUF427 domain-containing protein n=1 Tax=Chthonobacter albigriseus TaxID=1683161 RepID=UPI0015EFD35B|nr:DUF427 domain-containing protein [Chthonobacter albigriseus]
MGLLPTEDVNDFPPFPELQRVPWPVVVSHGGRRIAGSVNAWRLIERGQTPIVFIPADDVDCTAVLPSNQVGLGDDLGMIVYHDVIVGRALTRNAAWSYVTPPPDLAEIAGHYAFSPQLLDTCTVAGIPAAKAAAPQPGGWTTPNLMGVLEDA